MQVCSHNFNYWKSSMGLRINDLIFFFFWWNAPRFQSLLENRYYKSSSYHPPEFFHPPFKSPCSPAFQYRKFECWSFSCKAVLFVVWHRVWAEINFVSGYLSLQGLSLTKLEAGVTLRHPWHVRSYKYIIYSGNFYGCQGACLCLWDSLNKERESSFPVLKWFSILSKGELPRGAD